MACQKWLIPNRLSIARHRKKTHTHTYTIIEQIRIDCTLKWGCNLSHVILAHHWFCLAHYILLYGRTDDDIGLENGTNLESTPNVFLFDLVLNTTSFPFTLSIDLLYKECCRLYFISLLRSFIRFLCVFVSFSVRSAWIQFSGSLCMWRQVCRINAIHSANTQTHLQNWKLHSICLWIMMNILCDTFDENESFNNVYNAKNVCERAQNEKHTYLNSTLSRWCAIDVTSRVKSRVSFRWFISWWRWKLKAER